MAALFIIAKKWEQHKYSSTDKWIKTNVVYPFNRILYAQKKERCNLTCYNTMSLETLCRVNKPVTKCITMIPFIYNSRTGKSIETKSAV